MKKINHLVFLLIAAIVLQSCGIADLRTKMIKEEGLTIQNQVKGKQILENAWKKQGFDKLKNHTVYSYNAQDNWKGLLGKMGQIWPDMKSEMEFKYQVGTFDGQVHFLDGKEKGNSVGLQNWNYYEIIKSDTIFKDKNNKKNKRKVFGIAAIQYFSEMIDRLKNAPIISYAGEKNFRNQQYDLVFCTWTKIEPHMESDQYLVWINKKTGLMDFTQYTIRDNYLKLPGYKILSGAIEFADFKNIDGVLIPHTQFVYALKLRKNTKNNLHKLMISDFKFDDYNIEDLQIDNNIEKGGNFKK